MSGKEHHNIVEINMTFAISIPNNGSRSLHANIAGCEANTYRKQAKAYFKISIKSQKSIPNW